MRTAQPDVHGEEIFSFTGAGLTSGRDIFVNLRSGKVGSGITFLVNDSKLGTPSVEIKARTECVVNTLRNVVLGKDNTRLCIVEHLLAAVTLWGLEDLVVTVDGPEMPLGDGSAAFWIELLRGSGIPLKTVSHATHELREPIAIAKGDRSLIAVPSDRFSVTYLMDWQHPKIGKRWQTWKSSDPISQITCARTFASLKEHEMLGLAKDLVSLTADGFTHSLHFEDEPVRHKLLDLIGDLTLIGINPLRLKAQIISIKGGHELDVQLAAKIAAQLDKKRVARN